MNKFRKFVNDIEKYGYSQDQFGLTPGVDIAMGTRLSAASAGGSRQPSNSISPEIRQKTVGCSTLRITTSVVVNGTGSGNSANPIFFFGGDAFTNASRGYNAVTANAQLTTALTVANGKNVITFKYANTDTPGTNYTTYTVTLGTAGEYPFVLSSYTGDKGAFVNGLQMNISDASETTQLSSPMQTFFLNEFGKASSNDLSTPPDLYQQADDGIWLPHEFPISGRQGFMVDILDVNAFRVDLYLFIK